MAEIEGERIRRELSGCRSASCNAVCLHLYPLLPTPAVQIPFCWRDFQFTFGLGDEVLVVKRNKRCLKRRLYYAVHPDCEVSAQTNAVILLVEKNYL